MPTWCSAGSIRPGSRAAALALDQAPGGGGAGGRDRRRRSASIRAWPRSGSRRSSTRTMANAARVHAIERGADVAARHPDRVRRRGPAACRAARGQARHPARSWCRPPRGSARPSGFCGRPSAYRGGALAAAAPLGASIRPGSTRLFAEIEREARAVVSAAAPGVAAASRAGVAYMRYVGQGHEIVAPLPAGPLGRARIARSCRRPSTTPIERSTAGRSRASMSRSLSLG